MFKFLRKLNLPWSSKRFQGSDLDGNYYFEDASVGKGKRTIVYADGRNHISQYNPDSIPVEWQAWLRHTRNDPPTIQELGLNLRQQELIQERVLKLKESNKKQLN
jgi:NADH:ubiquinone oxidoreductase subunit